MKEIKKVLYSPSVAATTHLMFPYYIIF